MAQPEQQLQRKVPEAIVAAMRETNAMFSREVVAGRNTQALDHIYTVDARILPPGAEIVEGREKIKEFWAQAISAMGVKALEMTTVDAEHAGGRVVEIGRAELTTGDGQTMSVKYVVVWKQEDGRWKWAIDIWNPNG